MTYIGHGAVIERLGRMVGAGLPRQSLLFVGPAHVGKATLARKFAQIVAVDNQQDVNFDLAAAISDADRVSVDVTICAPEIVERKNGSQRIKDIGAEEIRDVVAQLARSPLVGARQVLVIDEADKLTITAQNALLKTLEEPSNTSVIILVTAFENALLPTVLSRLEKINFGLIDGAQVTQFAQNLSKNNSKYDIDAITIIAAGRIGLVHKLIIDENLREKYFQAQKWWQSLEEISIYGKISLAEELSKDESWLKQIIELWILLWRRDTLISKGNKSAQIDKAIKLLDKLSNSNANTRLALEDFLFNFV